MSEPDLANRPGWKAVERWLKESERPVRSQMRKPVARWGTRGLFAGAAIGFVILLLTAGAPLNQTGLVAFFVVMGMLAVPCALAGMLIGFAIWLFDSGANRKHP